MDDRCQQFTSSDIANSMLDMVDYKRNLYGKRVLENSCGEGNILCLVVERYIKDAMESGISLKAIVRGLENDIYGAEIKKDTYDLCVKSLDAIAFKYGIENVNWKIINGDVLKKPFKKTFHYIIGNPPYIAYKNLELKTRMFIKENYPTCRQGKPDYCYAFIENAIDYLHNNGLMVYLIPNSIFKNVFAVELREKILKHIEIIYDYPNCKLFKNALTSSAIMVLHKDSNGSNVDYYNKQLNEHLTLSKMSLRNKWNFRIQPQIADEELVRFDMYFKANITIATQCNKIFVVNKEVIVKNRIERGVLRNAISPRNQKFKKKEYLLFPYKVRNNLICHYEEKEFKNKYPNAFRYLYENRNDLDLRDADIRAQWFEYGRNQAIKNINKEMLLLSTVVTNEICVYDVSARSIPYSGIYIIPIRGYDLNAARRILHSEEFMEYVRGIGTPASGCSLRITANDINQFTFRVGDFFYG